MATKKNTSINGKEYYRIRRTIDGNVKPFYGTSKGDAERKYREYLEDLAQLKREKKQYVSNASFHDMAHEYIDTVLSVSSKYANSTKEKYEEAYRCHIEGTSLDKMRIIDVSPVDIQAFYNQLKVSKQVMQNVSKFMKGFCRWLQRVGYADDIISAVEIPVKPDNKKSAEIIVWSEEEVKAITNACRTPSRSFRAGLLPLVLLYTGTRLGEALALRYSDFHDGIVDIRRQYTHGEIKDPKYDSKRKIPIHPVLEEALAIHKEWHKREMGSNHYKTDYVFTSASGKLYDQHNIRTSLRRFYERIGIDYKEPHTYRRTFCTQLCRSGVPIQVASELMGHKNISVTAKFYTDIDKKTKANAIKKLDW